MFIVLGHTTGSLYDDHTLFVFRKRPLMHMPTKDQISVPYTGRTFDHDKM